MDKAVKKQVIRRTQQQKLALIEKWEKSGLPITIFCRQHNFSDSLFHGWLNKYRRRKNEIQPGSEFIPLPMAAPCVAGEEKSCCFAEIILPGGSHVKLYQPVTADYLRTLIS